MANEIGSASIEITADTGPLDAAQPAIEQALNQPLGETEQLAAQAAAQMEALAEKAQQLDLGDTQLDQFNLAMGALRENLPETEAGLEQVTSMLDQLLEQAEQSAEAMETAAEGANQWGGSLLNLGQENRRLVQDTGLVTGRVASLNQILTIAAGRTGQLAVGVRLLRSAFSLALAPGAALGVAVAGLTSATAFLIRQWKEWDQQAATLATTMREIGDETELTRHKVRGLIDDFDAVFNERVQQRLVEFGINVDAITTSVDEQRLAIDELTDAWFSWESVLRSNVFELATRAWNAVPLARYAEQLERTAAVEQRVDQILAANAARREAEFRRLRGVSTEAYGDMLSNLQRINTEAGKIGDNFVREFSGWQDVIRGVPDQLEITAQDIVNNAEDVLFETALMLQNYERAITDGLPQVAEAIKQAGPAANDAFSEVLNNPELAAQIERDLQDTARIIDEEAEKAVDRFVTDETKRAFRNGWHELSLEGIAGLIEGLDGALPQVLAAVDRLTSAVINRARDDLRVESPSKVFEDIGYQVPVGMAAGIAASTPYAVRTTDRTISEIVDAGRRVRPDAEEAGRDIGRAIGGGVADGLRESLEGALALLDATIRQIDVGFALEDAERRLEDLVTEFDEIPARIAELQDELAREREFAALITPEEQVAIERAEAALERILANRAAAAESSRAAEFELNRAVADRERAENALMGAWDSASRAAAQAQLDDANRRIDAAEAYQDEIARTAASEAEAALAAERLAEAQEAAVAPTREQVRLQEELEALQERRQEIGRDIARAELDVLRSQVDMIRSQIEYSERLNDVRSAGIRELERWARAAGLPASVVAQIVRVAGGDVGSVLGRVPVDVRQPSPMPFNLSGPININVAVDGAMTVDDARTVGVAIGEELERFAAYASARRN